MDKLEFHLLDLESIEQIEFLFHSQRDPRWSHLVVPQGPQFPPQTVTLEHFQEELKKSPIKKEHYIISLNNRMIGDISLMIDPPMLYKKETDSGWLGIGLFDERWHGTGIAAKAMVFIEERARRLDLTRLELGVFEFNIRSQKFAKKCGFIEIGRIPQFTSYQNKLWDDLRFEKRI